MRSSAALASLVILSGCFDPKAVGQGETDDADTDPQVETEGEVGGNTQNPVDTDAPEEEGSQSESTPIDTDAPEESTAEEGPIVECEGADGELDPMCPEDDPFCSAGVCTGCDELAPFVCAAVDADAPACAGNGACVACDEHDQCESGACHVANGRCFTTANTLWVDNHADCGSADGSEGAPLCTMDEALAVVGMQPEGSDWIVRVAGSTDPYEGSLVLFSDHSIAIIGPREGVAATLTSLGAWTVRADHETYLAHVVVEGGGDVVSLAAGQMWVDDAVLRYGDRGVVVDGGVTTVRRTTIEGNNIWGVDVEAGASVLLADVTIANNLGGMDVGGEADLDAVTVTDNYVDGGIRVAGTLRVRNSFLHDNLYNRGAIEALEGSEVEVLYSTIVDAIDCDPANVTIRNSIAIGGLACYGATITTSAVDAGFEGQGEGNVVLGEGDLANVFVYPDPYEPDYHLLPGSGLGGVARWRSGDPPRDFDGDPRPTSDDTTNAPGADELMP